MPDLAMWTPASSLANRPVKTSRPLRTKAAPTRKLAKRSAAIIPTNSTESRGESPDSDTKITETHQHVPEDEPDEFEDAEWSCICGQTAFGDHGPCAQCIACCKWQHIGCMGLPFWSEDIDEHYTCHECLPEDWQGLIASAKPGESPWEQNVRKFAVLQVLNSDGVAWFWGLYVLLSKRNVEATRKGRRLRGTMASAEAPLEYVGAAQAGVKVLLDRMKQDDLKGLHAAVTVSGVKLPGVYNALLAQAERMRSEGWDGCDDKLGILAELFGWAAKRPQSSWHGR